MPTGFDDLDFHEFHRADLPRLLAAGNGALAATGAPRAKPFAFRLSEGDAYTYLPGPDGIEVVPGDARADTVIELSQQDWQGIVHDFESAPGLLYAGRVKCRRGNAMTFVGWEPALRAMYTGRPIFDPETARLEDRGGAPLDLRRAFALDDDPEDMAHFLRTAGYLLVKRAFSAEELARYRQCAQRVQAAARKGDKRSWWGKNARGEEVLCRVTHIADAPLADLAQDPRLARLVALADEKLAPRTFGEEDGVSVIIKNPDMTEGLSDLPWHRDCGMGGHAIMCPILITSVFLSPASTETGVLRVLPGSHRGSTGFFEATDASAPVGVALEAEPGDLSLHYGDVMHAAPPPTGAGPYRASVVLAFAREGVRHHRGERSYNDVLLQSEDGQVEHLAKVAKRA